MLATNECNSVLLFTVKINGDAKSYVLNLFESSKKGDIVYILYARVVGVSIWLIQEKFPVVVGWSGYFLNVINNFKEL